MAPRQTKATVAYQQRTGRAKKSLLLKTAVRQSRRRLVTRHLTRAASKTAFKL